MIRTTKTPRERQDPDCPDLRALFGAKFRVKHDPARNPGEHADAWLHVMPTKTSAEIYPFGPAVLAVDLDAHRTIRARLDDLPCCRRHQAGDDCGSWTFDVKDFKAVAKVVKPYRRRRLTPEQRTKIAATLAAGRNARLTGGKTGLKTHPAVWTAQ